MHPDIICDFHGDVAEDEAVRMKMAAGRARYSDGPDAPELADTDNATCMEETGPFATAPIAGVDIDLNALSVALRNAAVLAWSAGLRSWYSTPVQRHTLLSHAVAVLAPGMYIV